MLVKWANVSRMGNHMKQAILAGRTRFARLAGFTLAEVLVALTLIALLAAVLLPTVAGQILKGDAGRVQQDLEGVRSAVDQFLADVHRYPGKYSDLSKLIVASSAAHVDINGAQYTSGLVNKWVGPYVAKDTISASVLTGYGGSIVNVFTKNANTNGVNYVTINIVGITYADFARIDLQIDGTADSLKGVFRFRPGATDTIKYLATPIQ